MKINKNYVYYKENNVIVLLGDCFEILKTLPFECVDAIVTDPPFGIGFKYNDNNKDVATNAEDYWTWFKPIYNEFNRILKPGGFLAIWQAHLYFKYYWDWFGDDIHIYAGCKNFIKFRKMVINYGYDPIVMKYKKGDILLKPNKPKRNINFFISNTAKLVSQVNAIEKKHPCPTPIDQVMEIIENFTLPNGYVIDPFAGSGTTGIACKKFNRKCILIEKDKLYCDIIVERLENEKKILESIQTN